MSSLYRYFPPNSKPYLPIPEKAKATSMAKETKVVNQEVKKTLSASGCRQRKRKSNFYYDPETRAKIGRFAAENGNKRAVERFSRELQRPLSESTVRGFKKAYYSELKKVKDQIKYRSYRTVHVANPTNSAILIRKCKQTCTYASYVLQGRL